jgi:hypothetical protein
MLTLHFEVVRALDRLGGERVRNDGGPG